MTLPKKEVRGKPYIECRRITHDIRDSDAFTFYHCHLDVHDGLRIAIKEQRMGESNKSVFSFSSADRIPVTLNP
jgi:hypothetical protein